ncbi:MAG: ribonuclease HII [Leptolyngbyaceae cyanobacterium bins.349]|nr:ribonuclease HII [Leptolyngbyaceae cyanobacterium bins.349]
MPIPRKRRSSTPQLTIPGLMDAATGQVVAGVDEVGRGALFGPVVAAAVIIPETALASLRASGVTDSKQLSAPQRTALVQEIRQQAVDYRIGYASVREIDRLNILQASLLAMKRAIMRLEVQPDLCLIDGNQRIPGLVLPQQTVVKGDQMSLAIAAASILAKVWRDELITRLAQHYPEYDLATNKGYGTAAHQRAIAAHGITPYHRKSFSPCQQAIAD